MQELASIGSIATELWEEALGNWLGEDEWATSDVGLLDSPRVRELGEQANRIGGFPAMAAAVQAAFYSRLDSSAAPVARAGISEINYRWNGIGDWQA